MAMDVERTEQKAPHNKKIDEAVLVTMLKAGYTQADAARHFGVAQTTMNAMIQKLRANGEVVNQPAKYSHVLQLQCTDEEADESIRIAVHRSTNALRWVQIHNKPSTLKEYQAEVALISAALDVIRKASPNHQSSAKNNRPMANIVQQVHGDVVNVTPSVDNPHKANVLPDKQAVPSPSKHPPGG